ncbi:MAG: sigma-E processing peptidase SpoIIGA [Firmicutes bacterium]|nr:sigma-E processing peptidase SpoIIGA [Bacillota bacterium]
MEIYLDVLILENIVMNYLILWTSGKLSKMKTSNLRLFIGALLGALYAAFLVVKPGIRVYYTAIAKILLSVVMVAVTFSPGKLNSFLRILAIFYISTFIFAGASFALIYLSSQGALVKNGMIYVYWQSKWTTIFLSIVTSIIILRIFQELIQYRLMRERLLTRLRIKFESRETDVSALIDTGNSLYDPLSNMPVIIVEFNAIRNILPSEICKIFEDSKENDFTLMIEQIYSSRWFNRFRLIPFSSLGKENGMLIGFKPDYVEIGDDEGKKGISDVIIGIYNKALSKGKHYRALLSPDLM